MSVANPALKRSMFHLSTSEHQFTFGTQYASAVYELPEDELDRVLADPRRPGAGEEIRDMGEES